MDGVVKVSDVDGPDSNANNRDKFRKLFSEFIKFLSKGSFLGLSWGHSVTDLERKINFL